MRLLVLKHIVLLLLGFQISCISSFCNFPECNQQFQLIHPKSAKFQSQSSLSNRRRTNIFFTKEKLPPESEKRPSMVALEVIGKSTSTVVSGTFFVALVYKRDALMVSLFIGSIGNAILSKVLKKIINQTRPPELDSANMKIKPSDGGMPSSHAMSLGFIGTVTALNLPGSQIYLILYSLVSLIYRVKSRLHTWQQVVVGFVLGSTNGYLWNTYALPHVSELVTRLVLNENGLLPIPYLVVPVIVGILVVGSVERRIGGYLERRKSQ